MMLSVLAVSAADALRPTEGRCSPYLSFLEEAQRCSTLWCAALADADTIHCMLIPFDTRGDTI